MVEPRVIDSDPWWVRANEIVKKPVFIIGTAIFLFLVVLFTVLIVIFLKGPEGEYGGGVVDYAKALIVTDERDLWALNLNTREKKLLQRTNRGISAFDVYKRDNVFWREIGSSSINSLSKKYRNLTQAREWSPTAAAVDFVTEKLYALDSVAGKLSVFEINSGKYGVAVTDLKDPVDLSLDPSRGVMFIVQKSNSVLKGNMDGTAMKKLISSNSVVAVAADAQTPKLYWSDHENIVSCDYEGKNMRIVVIAKTSTTSLGVSGNRIFWTSPPDPSNIRTLWNCHVIDEIGICDEKAVEQIDFDDPKEIKVYADQPNNIENPCKRNNGGCQHLCLLTASGGHSCACYIDYQLKPDSKSCESINEYILYVRGNLIRGKILDNSREAFTEARLPIRLAQNLELKEKPTANFDYNYYTNTLAYSDDKAVNTVDLTNEEIRNGYNTNRCLRSVAYDWITNDVYYLNDNCDTLDKSAIYVWRRDEYSNYFKTLRPLDQAGDHLQSLVLHPNTGTYFFSVLHKSGVTQIYKISSLNKLSVFVPDGFSANDSGLAIDYAEDRVYWLSQNTSLLYHANFKGEDVKGLSVSVIKEPRSISVHDRYVYVANLTSVWRLDKITGRGAVRIIPRFDEDESKLVAGVKIFSRDIQNINQSVPCVKDNGGCQQFCFRTFKRVMVSGTNAVEDTDELQKKCLCEDGKTSDGSSCI